MTFNNLPLYELTIDESDGIQFISIVDRPAIQSNFLCFVDNAKYDFSVTDPDKHLVSGLAMIPDLPIYRQNEQGEFYVVFTTDTIKKLAEKFFNEQRTLSVNIQHQQPTNDVVIIESYFIDHKRNIVPIEFADAPDGSWYVTMKINNETLWQSIKDGQFTGFSVEGFFDIKDIEVPPSPTVNEIKQIEELQEDIYDIIYKIIK